MDNNVDSYGLTALPGKVLVEFQKPVEKVGSIIVPEKSQGIRVDIARVLSIGAPLNEQQKVTHSRLAPGMLVQCNPSYGVKHRKNWEASEADAEFLYIYAIEELNLIVANDRLPVLLGGGR